MSLNAMLGAPSRRLRNRLCVETPKKLDTPRATMKTRKSVLNLNAESPSNLSPVMSVEKSTVRSIKRRIRKTEDLVALNDISISINRTKNVTLTDIPKRSVTKKNKKTNLVVGNSTDDGQPLTDKENNELAKPRKAKKKKVPVDDSSATECELSTIRTRSKKKRSTEKRKSIEKSSVALEESSSTDSAGEMKRNRKKWRVSEVQPTRNSFVASFVGPLVPFKDGENSTCKSPNVFSSEDNDDGSERKSITISPKKNQNEIKNNPERKSSLKSTPLSNIRITLSCEPNASNESLAKRNSLKTRCSLSSKFRNSRKFSLVRTPRNTIGNSNKSLKKGSLTKKCKNSFRKQSNVDSPSSEDGLAENRSVNSEENDGTFDVEKSKISERKSSVGGTFDCEDFEINENALEPMDSSKTDARRSTFNKTESISLRLSSPNKNTFNKAKSPETKSPADETFDCDDLENNEDLGNNLKSEERKVNQMRSNNSSLKLISNKTCFASQSQSLRRSNIKSFNNSSNTTTKKASRPNQVTFNDSTKEIIRDTSCNNSEFGQSRCSLVNEAKRNIKRPILTPGRPSKQIRNIEEENQHISHKQTTNESFFSKSAKKERRVTIRTPTKSNSSTITLSSNDSLSTSDNESNISIVDLITPAKLKRSSTFTLDGEPQPWGSKSFETSSSEDIKKSLSEFSLLKVPQCSSTPFPKQTPNTKEVSSKKDKNVFKRTKLPNFAQIHQRALNKVEDIREMEIRKAERAKLLLSGHKPGNSSFKKQVSPCKNSAFNSKKQLDFVTKGKIKSPKSKVVVINKPTLPPTKNNENKKPIGTKKIVEKGFTRFGFKLGNHNVSKQEQIKALINKTKVATDGVEKRRNVIQGVRSNRRFELLMAMRNKS